jgi:alkylation response protein AidB-like acyl-CoA dehydrogenase
MTCPAGEATQDDPPVLCAAIALIEQIKAAGDAAEAERRLPSSVATAIQEAGVFGMVMPRDWGGPELDPLTQIRVIEALAMADGSAGWCAMIGCDSGYVSAFLDQSVARAMYPDRLVATGRRRNDDRRGAPSAWRVSGERAVPLRQRLSSFRMGLARLHRRRRRGAAH